VTPDTVHLIAQDIRNRRAQLTALEKWARSLDSDRARREVFQQVNFWRRLYAQAETQIASGHASSESESVVTGQ
jgi:ABC-type transporter lipoprotein component MlaA